MRAFILLIVLAVLTQGCGYKGALYLPPQQPAQQPAAPPQKQDSNKQQTSPNP
ncbi:MAG: LPS translocon maturation chaperone LptM [Burkholderiales bacterium]